MNPGKIISRVVITKGDFFKLPFSITGKEGCRQEEEGRYHGFFVLCAEGLACAVLGL
jgi:hypothetical protein